MDNNEKRAEIIWQKYGFDFQAKYRGEIRILLNEEFDDYQEGSGEYLRILCGFLFCVGNPDDIELIKKVKYGINMDVGFMIDYAWIEFFEDESMRPQLIREYIEYYKAYFVFKA
ncbi:MAG: hypothetical protein FWD01_04080 [Defluviitaleaceae bacterium]|nr:hypothetical protein [Defluviitaleaceae bacterium]